MTKNRKVELLFLVGKSSLLLEKVHCYKNCKGTVTLLKNVVKSVAALTLVCFSSLKPQKAESSLPKDQTVLFSLGIKIVSEALLLVNGSSVKMYLLLADLHKKIER